MTDFLAKSRLCRRFGGFGTLLALSVFGTAAFAAAAPSDRGTDVAMLKQEYLAKEAALTPIARQRAQRLLARVEARAAAKTDAEFVVAAMQLTALADSGGSLVLPASPEAQFARLPIRVALFDDGLLIVRGAAEARGTAGAIVEAVDGKPIDQIVWHLAGLFGGAPPRRQTLLPMILEVPELLHAAGIADHPGRAHLRLRMPDGETVDTIFLASRRSSQGPGWWPDRWSNDGYAGSGWSYANARPMPLYLRDFEVPFRDLPLAGGRFMQLKWAPAWDRESGLREIELALERFERSKLPFIVIDLRFDHGASSPKIAAAFAKFAASLPPDTRLYLLVGRYTHHDGISSASAIMQSASSRAVAIGEEMGDWLNGPRWGGRLCFKSVAMCATFSRLSSDVAVSRAPAPFLILPAAPTAQSIRGGTDPALELALRLADPPDRAAETQQVGMLSPAMKPIK